MTLLEPAGPLREIRLRRLLFLSLLYDLASMGRLCQELSIKNYQKSNFSQSPNLIISLSNQAFRRLKVLVNRNFLP